MNAFGHGRVEGRSDTKVELRADLADEPAPEGKPDSSYLTGRGDANHDIRQQELKVKKEALELMRSLQG